MKIGLFSLILGLGILVSTSGCDVFPFPLPSGGGLKPGTSLENATLLELDSSGNSAISGTVETGSPAVYSLGMCSPGDRIIVAVQAAGGSNLDPSVAIFNADGELFALNDDVDLLAGRTDSYVNEVVVVASNQYYLAISKFFADAQGGEYIGTVRIERGGAIPARPTQYLLLQFGGGTITIPGENAYTLTAFDADDIDSTANNTYAGMTVQIKAKIIETVEENFEDTGVVVVSSDDNPVLDTGTFSTVYFGAYSSNKFGIAQSVDQGNRDRCDDAIVFTDGFSGPFTPTPSADGIAIAIGNVAAHEAGHLLGLSHVADVTALMDSTGTASTLLADQDFKTAPLHSTIFPFGDQNAPAILQMVVPK